MRERRTVAFIIFKFDRAWWEVELFFEAKSQQDRPSRAKDIVIIKGPRSSRYTDKIETRTSFLRGDTSKIN